LTIAVILIVPALGGCSSVQISTNQPIDAINVLFAYYNTLLLEK
jgi:hypothetical protein